MDSLTIRELPLGELENGIVLAPEGPLRGGAVEKFRDHVDTLLESTDVNALAVDFSGVEFIDSSTAGYLLNVHDRLRHKGGGLALAALRPGVKVVIDSIGLTTFFTVCETVEDAAQELS